VERLRQIEIARVNEEKRKEAERERIAAEALKKKK